jgi:hypothetical protein
VSCEHCDHCKKEERAKILAEPVCIRCHRTVETTCTCFARPRIKVGDAVELDSFPRRAGYVREIRNDGTSPFGEQTGRVRCKWYTIPQGEEWYDVSSVRH